MRVEYQRRVRSAWCGPSAPGNDFHNFKAVAGLDLPLGELRGGNRFAVLLNDDAARQQVLSDQKIRERTGRLERDLLPIGDDK